MSLRWALCSYELLTNERLFVGETDFATLEKVRAVEVVPPTTYNPDIPPELEQIVMRALEKNVEDRYQSAMDVHDDLQSFLYTQGISVSRRDLREFMRDIFADAIAREAARDEQIRASELAFRQSHPDSSQNPLWGADRTLSAEESAYWHASNYPGGDYPDGGRQSDAGYAPPGGPFSHQATTTPGQQPSAQLSGSGGIPAAGGAYATSHAYPQAEALQMEWDDDELPTHVYDESIDEPGKPTSGARPRDGVSGSDARGFEEDGDRTVVEIESSPPPALPPAPGSLPPAPGARDSNAPALGAGSQEVALPRVGQAARAKTPTDPVARPSAQTAKATETRSKYFGPALIAACLLLAAVAAFAYFVLPGSYAQLRFDLEPSEGSVTIDGVAAEIASFPVELELSPGPHKIEITHKGYTPYSQLLEVEPGQRVDLGTVELTPATRGIFVDTDPPGAQIVLDGKPQRGATPIEIQVLENGAYDLRIEHPGKRPFTQKVVVADGVYRLEKIALSDDRVNVELSSSPDGALVVARRGEEIVRVGLTPVTAELIYDRAEPWTLEVSKEGYRTFSTRLELPYGKSATKLALSLEAAEKDDDKSSERAEKSQADTKVAKTKDRSKKDPSAGSKTADKKPVDKKPAVKGNGKLVIGATPWATVYVDGVEVGTTPLTPPVSVAAGKHTVTLVNPNFNLRKRVSITITPGETTRRIFKDWGK